MRGKEAVAKCLDFIRNTMAKADGAELDVLCMFSDEIGSEVDGWAMRIEELRAEENDDDDGSR